MAFRCTNDVKLRNFQYKYLMRIVPNNRYLFKCSTDCSARFLYHVHEKISCILLTLNAPIATKVVCFSRLLKCSETSMSNSVDPDQTAPIGADQTAPTGAVCSGSMLFATIFNLSVMLGNSLQQTTSADDIFRCIFSWRFKV